MAKLTLKQAGDQVRKELRLPLTIQFIDVPAAIDRLFQLGWTLDENLKWVEVGGDPGFVAQQKATADAALAARQKKADDTKTRKDDNSQLRQDLVKVLTELKLIQNTEYIDQMGNVNHIDDFSPNKDWTQNPQVVEAMAQLGWSPNPNRVQGLGKIAENYQHHWIRQKTEETPEETPITGKDNTPVVKDEEPPSPPSLGEEPPPPPPPPQEPDARLSQLQHDPKTERLSRLADMINNRVLYKSTVSQARVASENDPGGVQMLREGGAYQLPKIETEDMRQQEQNRELNKYLRQAQIDLEKYLKTKGIDLEYDKRHWNELDKDKQIFLTELQKQIMHLQNWIAKDFAKYGKITLPVELWNYVQAQPTDIRSALASFLQVLSVGPDYYRDLGYSQGEADYRWRQGQTTR